MAGAIRGTVPISEYGIHYESIKSANRYDLWRRDMKFDSMMELLETYTKAAELLGEDPKQYIDDRFNEWDTAK